MQIDSTYAVRALQAANRIKAFYPREPRALADCTAERDAAHDLAALRQIIGSWASRLDVDQVTYEKGCAVLQRWPEATAQELNS